MIKKILFFTIVMSLLSPLHAQIFSQDFSASTSVLDYVSSTPNTGQFNGVSPNGDALSVSINDGSLRFTRTDRATIYAYRNNTFDTNPNFVQLKFDFEVSDYSAGSQNPLFSIFIGSGFSSASFGTNSPYASRIGILAQDTQGEFRVSTVDNIGGAPTTSAFSGKQTITYIVNNSGSDQSYTAPDASIEFVPNGRMDVWIGTTKGINDFSLRNTDSPTADITGFKIQATSDSGTGIFDFDNIEMKDLQNDTTPAPTVDLLDTPTEYLTRKHPQIWVSYAERQNIVNNIRQYDWAQSMYNQLLSRQQTTKDNHVTNPSTILNQIPSIPGNRETHREILNTAVESAILYYLTDDADYAQLSSDIINEYSKLLSVQDPLTFEFYSGNFNHLIPTRELFPRFAIAYDFIQPFLKKSGTTVFDITSNSNIAFNFITLQKALEVMADNVIRVGGNNSNHPVLELPGALYNVICMEDDATRENFFNQLLNGAANSKQPGINWMLNRFSDEDRLWPESVGYGKFTHAAFVIYMNVVDRYKPELNIISNNQDLLESLFLYENFLYPNGATMAYGDIGRNFTEHAHIFESILHIADKKGYTDLKNRAATTLQNIYAREGGYNPIIETTRLEYTNPLQLLWGVNIDASVSNAGEPKYSTAKVTHAGAVMQRNYSGVDDEQNGLMYYTHGGTYVHTHAGGIDMELYGAGYVIGPDYGADSFGSPIHEEYAVSYAAHNTIIVNGTSKRGVPNSGTWENITDEVVLEAVEPLPNANPIANNFSFSTQFLDDNINNLDQQRTNSIIRTSPTTGYYVDIFRSVSNTTNNFHDYLFHGLGDVMQIKSGNTPLSLTDTPNRYPVEAGAPRNQPGWQYYTNPKTSSLTSDAITARFDLQATNDYLHVIVPGNTEREYTSALAPPTKEVRNGYDRKDTQMFIMRKYGEAWDEPFIAIYEPSANVESSVKSTSNIYLNDKVVGVKVDSEVNGEVITDIVISNDTAVGNINLPGFNIDFNGRFGIVRTRVKDNQTLVSMYIGNGQRLEFNGEIINADASGKAYKEFTLDFAFAFTIEANNFTIQTVGETCLDKKNGSITINAALTSNYVVTLNGVTSNFTNSTTIENLSPGTYDFCINIQGDDFEQCYQATIESGVSLSGKIELEKNKAAISITQGTAPYTVLKNGLTVLETYQSNFYVDVNHGDDIQIKSKTACQGQLAKSINLLDDIKAYPNPSNGVFEMFIPSNITSINLEVYNIQSQLISSKTYPVNAGALSLDISEKPNGIYFVKVNSKEPVFVKIIKK